MANSNEAQDFDDILIKLATKIPDDNIIQLGKELGFYAIDMERYVATNSGFQNVTYDGKLAMLRDWHKKQTKEAALKNALEKTGLVPELFSIGDIMDGNYTMMHTSSVTQGTDLNRMSSKADIDFDGILKKIAKTICANSYIGDRVKAFGFGPTDIDLADQLIHSTENRKDRIVTDFELLTLADRLPPDSFMVIAFHLGLEYTDYDIIKLQNQSSLKDANFKMLMKWKTDKGGKVGVLDEALAKAACGGLTYMYKDI